MAELTAKALSKIVLPETMDDIEEYLKPQFPPKQRRKTLKEQDNEVQGRRIVMDGFGRWREIRPKKQIESTRLELVNADNLSTMKTIFRMDDSCCDNLTQKSRYEAYNTHGASNRVSTRGAIRHENSTVYNNIGMMTRSNIFPGVGNHHWNSTTARTFTKKPITPVENRKHFHGLQTDDFGVWAAANVMNERMKRAWGEYLESLPKAKANWDQPSAEYKPPKPQQTKPISKPKKIPPKPKQKTTAVTNDAPFQEEVNLSREHQLPPPPPPVPENTAADDDDFWDFYDKPFNKPNR